MQACSVALCRLLISKSTQRPFKREESRPVWMRSFSDLLWNDLNRVPELLEPLLELNGTQKHLTGQVLFDVTKESVWHPPLTRKMSWQAKETVD